MKHLLILSLLAMASLLQLNAQEHQYMNCFAVVAGKDATADGSVMFAHNEDDSGEQMLNIYNVPGNKAAGTNKYLWIEFPGMAVADAFLNEYGVAVASDACRSREDRLDVTDGGVLYELRTLVAQKARSARHAIDLLCNLVEERGYKDSGRSYIVADCNEAWIFAAVKGRRWIAQRVPDDQVMVMPNYYSISEVDLADTANFKASPDIITYAIERGWYDPQSDGKFSFREAYSAPATLHSDRNYIRHMSALNLLTGKSYSVDPASYPFSVKANRKITLEDMIEILSGHGENVEQKVKSKTPQQHEGCICIDRTVNASIFQLRNWLPTEIGSLVWTTGGRPCCEAFIPWYSGMTESPDGFTRFATAQQAVEKHFSDAENMRSNYPNATAWKFAEFWEWLIEDYDGRIGDVKERKDKFQHQLFKKQRSFEKSLEPFYNIETKSVTNPMQLQKKLNGYTAKWYRKYFKKTGYDAQKLSVN